MGWFGKIFGGTMGLFFGGPIGAVGGAALGHYLIDENDEPIPAKPENPSLNTSEKHQAIFFITTFSLLAKLAKADGVIKQEEIAEIEKLMKHDLKLEEQARNYAIQIFNIAKSSPDSFEDYAIQFYQTFSRQRQILCSMIDLLLRVAAADGSYHSNEETLIVKAVRLFKLSDAEYHAIKARHIRDSQKFYSILRSTPNDTDEHIKKNYRKLAQEYHPDKIVSKGLPPEFETFAKKKFQEIQSAYETIAKERGIK